MKQVKDMMHRKIISVRLETNVKEVCKLLIKQKISGIPVIDNNAKIIGFVSERDVIAAVSKTNFYNKTAKDIMTKKVYAVEDTTSLNEVSLIFSNEPFRHLPVTKKGKLVGMISRIDIVNQMLGHYY